jgi:hypothetical protein
MSRKSSILMSLAVLFVAVAANAAVTVVPIYNGSCVINWVNVTNVSGPQAATVDFSCNGTFYNQVKVEIHLEDPTASTGSTTSTGFYGSVLRTYPARVCTASYNGYCFNWATYPIPAEDTLSTSTSTNGQPFRAVATVKWDVGPATCSWWGCIANQQSVTASTDFYTP